MTLIACKECGKEISSAAPACPHCGIKRPKQVGVIGWIFALILLSAIWQCSNRPERSAAVATQAPSVPSVPVEVLRLAGGAINVGMLADDFAAIVPASAIVSQAAMPDPEKPGSMIVRKHCKMGADEFVVALSRPMDPGPYRIARILTR